MSGYGSPPQDPAGQQPGYGHAPYGEPAYGQNPYGQSPYGQPPYGQNPYGGGLAYAHWIKRVGAYLVDVVLAWVLSIPVYVGLAIATSDLSTDPVTGEAQGQVNGAGVALVAVGVLLVLAFFVWNICLRQGRTGYTIGKSMIGIQLIKESTGQPIGAGMAFVRYLCHFFDSLLCYIGWLWPLWDAKRQTFADKIVGTVVIERSSDLR